MTCSCYLSIGRPLTWLTCAQVALNFAATHPTLVDRLVLSCPGVPRAGTPEAAGACAFLSNQALTIGPFIMADATASKNLAPSPSPLAHALVRGAVQLSSSEGYVANCELIRDAPAPNWGAIACQVLIIAGTEDVISSVAAAETVKGEWGRFATERDDGRGLRVRGLTKRFPATCLCSVLCYCFDRVAGCLAEREGRGGRGWAPACGGGARGGGEVGERVLGKEDDHPRAAPVDVLLSIHNLAFQNNPSEEREAQKNSAPRRERHSHRSLSEAG